jgi:hypothetical protein
VSRGDKDFVERRSAKVLSDARSRERNERSSVVAVDDPPNGSVNWGGVWSSPEGIDMSDGLESALVGREDLRKV